MPPRLPGTGPGTGYGEAPGPNRHGGDYAERPVSKPAAQFGIRRENTASSPLPLYPHHQGRPQPWPLQQRPEGHTAAHHDQPPEEFASPEDVVHTPAPARRTRGPAIAYTTLGFLAGIVFWHAVGFWTLVHKAVFSGPRLEVLAEPDVPIVTAPPVVAFDEDKLRDSARRPALNEAWQRPQNITTGSIRSPQDAATHPLTPPAARILDHMSNPPVATGPGGISWQPAVSRAP